MSIDRKMSEVLGIEQPVNKNTEIVNAPISNQLQEKEESQIPQRNDSETDFSLSRNVFRNLIDSGSRAIENMTELAKESESPRAYEVLATLIKTVSESTKDLYDIHKKKKDLYEEKTRPAENITVDKAIFYGSTAELLAKIKNKDDAA